MQELFQRLETESDGMGLAVNRSKTKLMVVDRAKKLPRINNIIPGVDIVDHYVYLGALIYDDGDCVPEIKRRIGIAKDAMTRLNVIWKKRGQTKPRTISNKMERSIKRGSILNQLLLGCQRRDEQAPLEADHKDQVWSIHIHR
ncbi:uncharacterized protein LOC134799007 [Cydia splendana]|uniref:uncharacterized protein LOC134799007 n=1 Tax=Cydia splendana TaxID=1100963 RepID=UPI00300C1421